MTFPLIEAPELFQDLRDNKVKVIRALLIDPATGQEDRADSHFLPNTVNFDIDGRGSDKSSYLPHTMPTVAHLQHYLGELGVSADDALVIYDNRGMFSAPRLWWMLRSLGHHNVRILNGGLAAWMARFPVHDGCARWQRCDYKPQPQKDWFIGTQDVVAAMQSGTQILDARSAERFFARAPEPREWVRGGHIPSSKNLPYASLLTKGRFNSLATMQDAFTHAGVDLNQPLICSCGSGITACIIGLAALMCGAAKVQVYDGSWTEWGSTLSLPVATGRE